MQKHAAHVDDRDSALETVQEPPPLLRVEAAAHVLVNKVEGGFESVVVPRARGTPEQRARAGRASDARDGQGSCTMVKVDCFSRWTFLSCSKPTRNAHGAHARWRGKLGGGEFRKRLHYRKTSSSHHQRGEGIYSPTGRPTAHYMYERQVNRWAGIVVAGLLKEVTSIFGARLRF